MRMDDYSVEKWQRADDEVRKNLPPGVKLVRTLRGHTGKIGRITWSPNGRMLASPSNDKTIRLWDTETGECLRTIETDFHEIGPRVWQSELLCVSFDPKSRILAYPSTEHNVQLLEIDTGKIYRNFEWKGSKIWSIAFSPDGDKLAIAGNESPSVVYDVHSGKLICKMEKQNYSTYVMFDPFGNSLVSIGETIIDDSHRHDDDPDNSYWYVGGEENISFWDPTDGFLFQSMEGHQSAVLNVAFNPLGQTIASASLDKTIKLWELNSGRLIHTLEGHTSATICVSFIEHGQLLASKSADSCRIWKTDSGDCVAIITDPIPNPKCTSPSLAFHPLLPLLANVGSDPGMFGSDQGYVIHIYELDPYVLFQQVAELTVKYTSAKIVLVGDSGVGKTELGWRLALGGEFKEHSSTPEQQYWLLNQLCKQRSDGTQCEALLWDFAGQPDHKFIHTLFFDNADLALVLFDPTRSNDPRSSIEFWLRQLKVEAPPPLGTPTILIASRSDRGTPRLTKDELDAFCKQRGIKAYILTSAMSGEGIKELVQLMQNMIPWEDKPATVTTETFKRIKDFVLDLKEKSRRRKIILTPKEFRQRLEKKDRNWKFNDAEMITAVGHLENHGYLMQLKTSLGESRILLAPELLHKLVASIVLEARMNREGLGSLEEQRLLSGQYKFSELEKLTKDEQEILLDSVAVLFLEHNICFRETNPLNNRAYLVFPELINMKKPLIEDDVSIEDGMAYTVSGAVENVYASLVVLMGYTETFTRKNQWQNYARYEVGTGHVCGFHLEGERDGELDFVLYFGTNTPDSVKMLFQGLFENFLARRNLTVQRIEPVLCSNNHVLNRAVVRELIFSGEKLAYCSRCREEIKLPKANQPISLTREQAEEVEANRRAADQRSRFERVLFRLKSYVIDQDIISPKCFISYAWGIQDHENWVEWKLATDLQKAGITVLLDRWTNSDIGASVSRFVEGVGKADRIIVVGTPLYRKKYENNDPMGSFVVAAEGDLIGNRMIGTEIEKKSVLPVLLEGTDKSSFPILLHGRIYADFRKNDTYFEKMFELLLSIYQIQPHHPVAIELHESLVSQRES